LDVSGLATALEALNADLARARGDHHAGRAERLRLAGTYGSHAELMRPEHVAPLRAAARDDADTRALLSAVVRAQILGGCAPVLDRVRETLETELIRSLHDKWYFPDAERRIAEEGNRKQRKVIDQSRRRVLGRLEGDLQEALYKSHTLMVDRGFEGYGAMCAELSGVDLGALADDMDGLLEDSGPRYRALLADELREAGVFPDDARYHDLVYLHAGRFGPANGLPDPGAAVTATLGGLGLTPESLPGLVPDLEARDGKRPGALACAVRVPEEIHLIVAPDGRWDTFGKALAAAGEAAALACVPSDLPFARRGVPDVGLLAAWGAVFGSLFGNEAWLAVHAPKVDADAQHRRFALWWLFRLRYLAGSAKYAAFLHGPGDVMEKADAYEHFMHNATGFRIERENYLWMTDWFMDAALRFRGHCFGGQVVEALEGKFGPAWFAEPGAAQWLKAAWAAGTGGLEPVAAACDIGEPGDIWPLTERLEGVLGEFTDE
jgi:hypothetical protein